MDGMTPVLESPFFKSLPPTVLRKVAPLVTATKHGAGTHLFREGQRVDFVHFVSSGQVAVEMDLPGRGRQRILSLGPGDLLGWTPLFENAPMIASATALTDVELCRIPAQLLRDLCAMDPEVGYHFMRQVARSLGKRLLATRLQLLDLFGTAHEST